MHLKHIIYCSDINLINDCALKIIDNVTVKLIACLGFFLLLFVSFDVRVIYQVISTSRQQIAFKAIQWCLGERESLLIHSSESRSGE